MNLNVFMQNGINGIMKRAGRYYLTNTKGLSFLAKILPQLKKSAELRKHHEEDGLHIPPFLIASIASQCNLRCAGCYARAGGTCCDAERPDDLTSEEWNNIFAEASDLGVSFILLAGGEPLMRRDIIGHAAQYSNIIYPIFTNGTMIDQEYITLFNQHRNLIPVLSIEGTRTETDSRRGIGVHASIADAMQQMHQKHLLFGTSITVTSENMDIVLTHSFIAELRQKGCGLIFFIEYVPAEKDTEHLALSETEQTRLQQKVTALKQTFDAMILLSFPGDEESMGGCLASGRGFFHINPTGGAEPCPFSPYAKYNLKTTPIKEILRSQYFKDLRQIAHNAGPHTGGCVLFEHESEVQTLHST